MGIFTVGVVDANRYRDLEMICICIMEHTKTGEFTISGDIAQALYKKYIRLDYSSEVDSIIATVGVYP